MIAQWIPLASVFRASTISRRMNSSRRPRATALLVHGMGASPAWWNPLLPGLECAGLTAFRCGCLAGRRRAGNVARRSAGSHRQSAGGFGRPFAGRGGVSGGGACEAVGRFGDAGVSAIFAGFTPEPPPDTGLPPPPSNCVERFLRAAGGHAPPMLHRSIHFVGSSDRGFSLRKPGGCRFPWSSFLVPAYGLNRSTRLADQLFQHLRLRQNDSHK